MDTFEKHGIEILRFLDDRSLQVVLWSASGEDGLLNDAVALAMLNEPEQLQIRVLNNVNRVRRRSIEYILAEYVQFYESSADKDPFLKEIKEAQDKILGLVKIYEARGYIILRQEKEVLIGDYKEEREKSGDKEEMEEFDLTKVSFGKIMKYWLPVCRKVRRESPLVLDAIMDKIKDPFSRHLFEMTLDDCSTGQIVLEAEKKRRSVLYESGRRLEIMRIGIRGLVEGDNPYLLMKKLNSLFPDAPLTAEAFFEETSRQEPKPIIDAMNDGEVIKNIVVYACKARHEGILILETYAEGSTPYWNQGLLMAVDGWMPLDADEVLKNKKKALMDELQVKMKMFEKICLGLKRGLNPRLIHTTLNSFLTEEYKFDDFNKYRRNKNR